MLLWSQLSWLNDRNGGCFNLREVPLAWTIVHCLIRSVVLKWNIKVILTNPFWVKVKDLILRLYKSAVSNKLHTCFALFKWAHKGSQTRRLAASVPTPYDPWTFVSQFLICRYFVESCFFCLQSTSERQWGSFRQIFLLYIIKLNNFVRNKSATETLGLGAWLRGTVPAWHSQGWSQSLNFAKQN